MSPSVNLFSLVSLALAITSASAQLGYTPLYKKQFPYDKIPYKVDTDVGLPRGEQIGYNQCNSTTEGPNSLCQTAIINSLDDFCLWAPPSGGKEVGEIEGEMVAWCTKAGHGARVIPDGTITGVQFTKAPNYIQVVGFMKQTNINMVAGDQGGEMDPHGADLRGNPMGGLLYTTAWGGGYKQVIEWHNFMGSNYFCLKACDPSKSDDEKYCEHIYDTQGCGFNAPSNAKDGVFESCASDNQNFPGQGEPVPPSSSLCSTFASTAIYGAGATVQVPLPGGGPATTTSTTPSSTTTATSSSSSTTSLSTTTASTTGGTSSSLTTSTVTRTGETSPSRTDAESPASETSPLGNAAGLTKKPASVVAVIALSFMASMLA